jgi:undecaprenyl-diphosphatase
MMDWVQILVLSLVQGITEFLPVSSSAHLILVPGLLGWKDQGLAFDIAVHLGTLMAVIIYFRLELFRMIVDFYSSLKGKGISAHARYLWFIGFATIPVGLFGLLMKHVVETALRAPWVIALTTIGFGLLLWLAENKGKQTRKEKDLNWKDVWVIGFSQALSLIPGTSRSGVTLTAGLFNGLTREAAARFSFLLSILVIILAGGLETLSLIKSHEVVDWEALALGIGLSGISGYICIHYFLKLLNKVGLFPFVLYRIGLGIFIIFRFYL